MSGMLIVFLQFVAVFIFWPIEYFFPRDRISKTSVSRVFSILFLWGVALAALAACQSYLFQPMIDWLAPFQVFSFARLPMPVALSFIISLLLVDFLQYALHYASHKIPALWAIHSVHHTDKHVTAVTGLLHHPIEAAIGFIITLFFLILFGISIQVILVYELLALVHNPFTHANINLPKSINRILRILIVTPDMHRIHHSVVYGEGNSNFSQIFPYWDWMFTTYLGHPSQPIDNIRMGLPQGAGPKNFNLLELLILPFDGRAFAGRDG